MYKIIAVLKKLIPLVGILILILTPICLTLLFVITGNRLALLCLIFIIPIIYVYITTNSKFEEKCLSRLRGWVVSKKLKSVGDNLCVGKDARVLNPDCISIGKALCPLKSLGEDIFPSRIKIGNRVHIGPYNRIASMDEVIIEDDVLFAAFVHITDHSHDYRDAGVPVRLQGVFSKGPVTIKRGSWLAFGSHILAGVTIGEYSVVAANAVVTKDVPPYSVVAGNPAKIISRYSFETKEWVKIKS